ncbi:MAG: ATP-binding protein [Endomicrobium sp.]|jgi:hypothetical protein|nr:ATP-binding protein [Endomicrobium sp.]
MQQKQIKLQSKKWYNGYSWDGKTFAYNPFSTLLFFKNKRFNEYWFETGTPTFLIKQIEKEEELKTYIEPQAVSTDILRGADDDLIETTGMLFQTGYLTVKKEEIGEDMRAEYTIDFPNMEVKNAFLTRLLARYAKKTQKDVQSVRGEVYSSLRNKDEEKLKESLTKIYANIPYDILKKEESYYEGLFLTTAIVSGFEVDGEAHTDKGRIDAALKKGKEAIVVEIKY